MSEFASRLSEASRVNRSAVCVGLDPDLSRMPIADVRAFNRAIIDATRDLVCAYKPNLAFYEALGIEGLEALRDTLAYARERAPDAVLLGDAKRGDIQSTNVKHAEALFDYWGFDAITVNGFAGGESLAPFFERADKGVFVWCRASNPGSQEFQDKQLVVDDEQIPRATSSWWTPDEINEYLMRLAVDNRRMPHVVDDSQMPREVDPRRMPGVVYGVFMPRAVNDARMPIPDIPPINRAIIDATHNPARAYKPNLVSYGAVDMDALLDRLAYARKQAPGTVLLGDAKWVDIQSAKVKYEETLFDFWGFASDELHASFYERAYVNVLGRGRSFNPDSQDFQDKPLTTGDGRMPLYEWIAARSMTWTRNGNLGMVVGATYPGQLRVVRDRCPGIPILIPAVGAQGGELEEAVKNGLDTSGDTPNILINSSRGILYADGSAEGFADGARAAAASLREGINAALEQAGWKWR